MLERGNKVVLVTGWPKEETWDGEVGEDIIVFNEKHYISLYMYTTGESCTLIFAMIVDCKPFVYWLSLQV